MSRPALLPPSCRVPDANEDLQAVVHHLQRRLDAQEAAMRRLVQHLQGFPPVDLASAPVAATAWEVRVPRRSDALAWPIYEVLRAAHQRGEPRPTALDLLTSFERKRPACVLDVRGGELSYRGLDGVTKIADLEQLRHRIVRMTREA